MAPVRKTADIYMDENDVKSHILSTFNKLTQIKGEGELLQKLEGKLEEFDYFFRLLEKKKNGQKNENSPSHDRELNA